MQQITEQKLKAFSIGTMGKRQMSKKELEDQRKKEQEEAAAQVCYNKIVCCTIEVCTFFICNLLLHGFIAQCSSCQAAFSPLISAVRSLMDKYSASRNGGKQVPLKRS
jgi:hypothetical protein